MRTAGPWKLSGFSEGSCRLLCGIVFVRSNCSPLIYSVFEELESFYLGESDSEVFSAIMFVRTGSYFLS